MRTVFGLVIVLGLLAGCNSEPATPEPSGPTESDYRATVQSFAECLNDRGWQTTEPRQDEFGPVWGVNVVVPPEDGRPAEIDQEKLGADWAECAEQTSYQDVELEYLGSLLLTGEAWDAEYATFVGCLADAGVTVGPDATFDEVRIAVGDDRAAYACLQTSQFALYSLSDQDMIP